MIGMVSFSESGDPLAVSTLKGKSCFFSTLGPTTWMDSVDENSKEIVHGRKRQRELVVQDDQPSVRPVVVFHHPLHAV
jgi:hypothetical protein